MKRAIALLFLVAGVAFLVAWLSGGESSGSVPSAPPTSPQAPRAESGDSAAWSTKSAAPVVDTTSPAPGAAAGAAVAPGAGPGSERVDAKAGIEALARVAAAARARAGSQPEEPASFPANKEGIQGAMRAAIGKVKECYDPWVKMNPELQGKLTMSYVISESGGAPENVDIVEGGLGSDALDGCVRSVIEGELQFEPPADGAINVKYPLVFRSADLE